MTFEGHHNPGHRSERIAEEIKNEISLMLAGELKDPRLALPLVVTEVRLGAGMRIVRVFVRLDGSRRRARIGVLAVSRAAAKFVRHELVERLNLRRAPEVLFLVDVSEEYGQHINDLLHKVNQPEKS